MAFLKQKNIQHAEPEKLEQLSLNTNGQHSDEQLQILKRFAQRKTEPTKIAIDQIVRDQRAQQREELDPEVVAEYSMVFFAGDKLPPVKVKYDGTYYWLYDGFHTIRAAEQAGQTEVEAQITPGNLREAILESVGVNADHGLRRTRETKRRSVMTLLRDPEWGQWSDREIARKCKVSNTFVSNLRKNPTVNVVSDNIRNYKDKHGNISKMNVAKIGKTDPENAETDKLSDSPTNQPEPNPPVPELEPNQLVELNFTSFDGVSENLKPVEQVSLTLPFEPKEYIALMNIYGDRRELFDAIKQSLTGVKPT